MFLLLFTDWSLPSVLTCEMLKLLCNLVSGESHPSFGPPPLWKEVAAGDLIYWQNRNHLDVFWNILFCILPNISVFTFLKIFCVKTLIIREIRRLHYLFQDYDGHHRGFLILERVHYYFYHVDIRYIYLLNIKYRKLSKWKFIYFLFGLLWMLTYGC